MVLECLIYQIILLITCTLMLYKNLSRAFVFLSSIFIRPLLSLQKFSYICDDLDYASVVGHFL